ncbi:cbb3-type cytochrome c oxidase subunit 3 [Ornithobacterium rhinotracheale]|uniref:cbb3-type cytochrome c oxidase subunit 3 n=1 Tax=Ornithobacterium rhinotracheale TaxID=28251 RepID=UPI00129CA03E|nr:cbb3-type cytochrome c oxidase subunit 3 [Ornithobacterium rhinotracheale]MRI62528.1 cbb3-type cytochrome c oxidase subunit 3 [Ornithobacterium rhinotracheale]MRJ07620.1 cbb3-type cytochrome c oxidase subunit 3 [Ornithobacterium rhinotracheale]MRJ10246.1 cbb3-type cytochrome c oxidase subunit 3 [Ornithobacterium rhinotracheale]UOH78218.1 cbb3-type cytochrome c oxidase subunit 3 [Ornithobacterium rhinotracheale]
MLKYFKEYFGYANDDILQVVILLCSIAFFVGLVYSVLKKPKNYYKKESEMPLEEDSVEDKIKF